VNRVFLRDLLLQSKIRFRLEIAERKILEFALDDGHAEAVGDGRVNIHGLASDAKLLGGLEEFEGAHVVQASASFHDDDTDVVDHRQEHLADVFRPVRASGAIMFKRLILVTPSTSRATSSPKSFPQARERETRYLR